MNADTGGCARDYLIAGVTNNGVQREAGVSVLVLDGHPRLRVWVPLHAQVDRNN